MGRANLIRTSHFYYHVTTRTNNKEWFKIPINQVWEILKESLQRANSVYPVVISQFVLMTNHYHLLILTPNQDLDRFMQVLNQAISKRINEETGAINQKFGGRYKWSVVAGQNYLINVYRYIYQNPLRAELCEKCEKYPYSTLWYEFRNKKPPFPFTPTLKLDKEMMCLINEQFQNDMESAIRKGLCKSKFKEVIARRY